MGERGSRGNIHIKNRRERERTMRDNKKWCSDEKRREKSVCRCVYMWVCEREREKKMNEGGDEWNRRNEDKGSKKNEKIYNFNEWGK
jgi:hypothetical protein